MADNPYRDFVRRFYRDPVGFVRVVLGAEPDAWQIQFLEWIAQDERRIAIASGHGVGKSTAAAWAMLWYLLTRYPVKVVVTAPTSAQLYDALFAELKHWINLLPPALYALLDPAKDRVALKADTSGAFISARTSRAEAPEALQGVHSENVMLIADEASGVPEAVFEAAAGSMSGHNAVTILLGNPTRTSGLFFDAHHRMSSTWRTLNVSCLDSPRVSDEYVEEMKERYGEDSNAYRVRVLGQFPRSGDDTVIPLDLVEDSFHRDVLDPVGVPEVWGLDVARFGDDASCLVRRRLNVVPTAPRIWRGLDTMQLAAQVKAQYDECDPNDRPSEILVDSIGLGAGTVDRLRQWGMPVRGVNVSESPAMKELYHNLRAELWYQALAWLQARDTKLPKDEALLGELTGPRYKFTDSGKILVESKADMKKRGMPSPNRADALILTFASDAATALYGVSATGGWNRPLRRNIARVD